MSQVGREVRTVVCTPVFLQSSRDEDLGETLSQGEFDVRICLIVAQQNIEARLLLLDEVVLKSQRFPLVFDDDVLNVDRFAHQRAGLGILRRRLQQIGAHSRPQALCLADVDHLPLGVLVHVHARADGQCANFLLQIHRMQTKARARKAQTRDHQQCC